MLGHLVDLQEGSVRSRIFEFSTVLIIEATMALESVSCVMFMDGCMFAKETYSRPKLRTPIKTSLILGFRERCHTMMIGRTT